MKNLSVKICTGLLSVLLSLAWVIPANAQSRIGIKKVHVWASLAFASPKDALKSSYSFGDAMQLYYGVDAPFAFLDYGKKQQHGAVIAAFLDHEKANFTDDALITDGLDAKFTSAGLRIYPFTTKHLSSLADPDQVDESASRLGQDVSFLAKLGLVILHSSYIDLGFAHAALIEKPTPDVIRTTTVFGYGLAPALAIGRKTSFHLDVGFRKYSWTNGLNTKSSVNSFRLGFGLGINL